MYRKLPETSENAAYLFLLRLLCYNVLTSHRAGKNVYCDKLAPEMLMTKPRNPKKPSDTRKKKSSAAESLSLDARMITRQSLKRMTKEEIIDRFLFLESQIAASKETLYRPTPSTIPARSMVMPMGTLVYAPQTQFLTITSAVNKMFGVAFGPLGGLEQFTRFQAFRPDGTRYAPDEWPFMRSLSHDEVIHDEEMQVVREDGSLAILLVSSHRVRSSSGELIIIIIKDMTGQKALADALHQSEADIRALLDASPSLGFVLDTKGTILACNQAFAVHRRMEPSDLVGRSIYSLNSKEFAAITKARHQEAIHGKKPVRFEVELEGRMYESTVYPIVNGNGGVRKIVVQAYDVTERRRVEEALRESEYKLRLFVEHAPAAIAMFDTSMRYLAASRRWLSDYNLGNQDVVGRSHYEIFPEIPDRWKEIHKRCLAGTIETCDEDAFPRLDGTLDWVKWEIHPWYEKTGKVGGLLMCTEVITERKQMQEALHKSHGELEQRIAERTAELQISHDRFHSLVELLPEIIFETDMTGRCTYANQKALEAFGVTRDEVRGLSISDVVSSKDHPGIEENAKRILQGEPLQGAEYAARRKDGSEFPAFIRASCIERNGKVEGLRGIVIDLTETKKAEAEKALLQEQINQAQRMEAIGTLAGGIAHDFNNMLAVILGNAELALDDIGPDGPRHSIEQILAASKRSRELVKQILTFSRKSEGVKTHFSLVPIIRETTNMLRGSLPPTINIKEDLHTQSDVILANQSQIEQIFMNLATNAVQAMGEDGGTLAIRLSEKMFVEGQPLPHPDLRPGRYLRLTVRDTGPGIPPQIRDRIFEPFFSTKEPGQGTGMGLAVVYGIVKSHHGAVTVSSRVGKWSIFSVFLPAASCITEQELPKSDPVPTGREHVLIVDDEPSVLEAISRRLKRLGYKVEIAHGGTEGLKLFQRKPDVFDLVITDHVMPRMTGLSMAETMLQIRADLPIVLASGYSELVTADKLQTVGIAEFLTKPIETKTLAETVRRALDGKAGQDRTKLPETTTRTT